MIILLTLIMMSFSELSEQKIEQPTVWKIYRHEGRRGGRILFVKDEVLFKLAENANFSPDWEEEVIMDEKGNVRHELLKNGWAYSEYESEEKKTVFLEGSGFRMLFVNGKPFVGDHYSKGYLRLPIPLQKGVNRFLVKASRGGFNMKLFPVEGTCSISPRDSLLPDLRDDILIDSYGSVVILNHTDKIITDAVIEVGDSNIFKKVSVNLGLILPYGIAKSPFPLKQLRHLQEEDLDEKNNYKLAVTLRHGETSQTKTLSMPIRKAGQPYKATKLSEIDGSVQYYAVRPPINFEQDKSYALYLTLHGAAVEATGQIGAYSSKRDAFIVAPTNRRPYGFDWQEWGRLDAIETLELFTTKYRIDQRLIYLTGHSMGGHGTWYLGALYPSRFAAICPSAGWISFFSYGRRNRNSGIEVDLSPFEWAQMENDTLGMVKNYTHLPIYILHGEKDNNVPVRESRKMVTELEKFHKDFVYHEQPGAGHWWGNQCVDWLPLFEFCRRHINPLQPLSIKFKTPNPQISSSYAWITIQSQNTPSKFSYVSADADPRSGKVQISTDNVERLKLTLKELLPQNESQLNIDNTQISVPVESDIYLLKTAENIWEITDCPPCWAKGPHRNGPFKLAFDKKMVWVYGTSGSEEGNAAIIDKIRYDAQVWWYRGNGNVTIIPDNEFNLDKFEGRNIILYGNADNNSAFDKLLKYCPIKVHTDEIKIGQKIHKGELATLFVYPRQDSDENLIGVIGMTSPKAVRMNFPARYFISGVTSPDYVIFSPEVLSKGMEGILQTGYFDNNWNLITDTE